MKYPDETLMAYVDNEVDADTRRAIDADIASDPEVAARVARQRTLVGQLQAAYAPITTEPIPSRLLDTLRDTVPERRPDSGSIAGMDTRTDMRTDNVISLNPARAKKTGPAATRWSWQILGGIAASLVIGVMLGRSGLPGNEAGMMSAQDGQLLARGTLATALNTQAAGAAVASGLVKISLSFAAKSGTYCRAFTLKEGPSAGVACRDHGDWRIELLTREKNGDQASPAYRMAGSTMPDSILRLIDAEIAGEALDAAGEQAAIQRGWQAQPR